MRNQITATNLRRTVFAAGLVLLLAACGSALADSPSQPTTTPAPSTTAPESADSTTTQPPVAVPGAASVPELSGLTLADARQLLAEAGLGVLALPHDVDSAVVVAQEPAPGIEVDDGTVVTVDLQVLPTCNPPDPIAPGVGQVIISVPFECGNDTIAPTRGIGVPRIVPEQGGATVDRIEWMLRSLLAGPTDDERMVGFVSAFDEATADALNGVSFSDGHVVADFNDAIIVNNMSTSTGSVFFNAELLRGVFQQADVDSVEFQLNGDCEAWSALFESDGCRVITRTDWDQDLAEWDKARDQ